MGAKIKVLNLDMVVERKFMAESWGMYNRFLGRRVKENAEQWKQTKILCVWESKTFIWPIL